MSDRATLVPEQELDRNDGKEWSASDIEDLALALKDGGTIEGGAFLLCRAGTVDDVRQQAKKLGLIDVGADIVEAMLDPTRGH